MRRNNSNSGGNSRAASFTDALYRMEARKEAAEAREAAKELFFSNPEKDYGIRRTAKGDWYRRTARGGWARVVREDVTTYLVRRGLSAEVDKDDELSLVDLAMDYCIDYWLVDYAQEIAGYTTPGQYRIGNREALVTRGASLIELKPGTGADKEEFLDFWLFLGAAFPAPGQLDAFLGWLQQAVQVLRTAKPPSWAHGLALLLIGDPGIGKTSLQHLITLMLAGRATDPKIFFKGDSSFNAQLAENEHWLMSDPGHKGTKAERDSFLANLKESVANVWMGCHPKGEKEITIPTYRRSTISLNPDRVALSILTGMEPGTLEKTLILDFKDGGKYRPDGPGGMRYGEWAERMETALPYFLHWLLNVYKVPAELSDARYGVRYTNPTYAAELAATTVEAADIEVKEIVGIGVFTNLTGPDELNETGPLTVGEVIDRVIHPSRSPVASRARRHPNIFYNDNNTRLGNLLSKWAGEPEKTKFYDIPPFAITRHLVPGGKSRYSFRRGPVAEIKRRLAEKEAATPEGGAG